MIKVHDYLLDNDPTNSETREKITAEKWVFRGNEAPSEMGGLIGFLMEDIFSRTSDAIGEYDVDMSEASAEQKRAVTLDVVDTTVSQRINFDLRAFRKRPNWRSPEGREDIPVIDPSKTTLKKHKGKGKHYLDTEGQLKHRLPDDQSPLVPWLRCPLVFVGRTDMVPASQYVLSPKRPFPSLLRDSLHAIVNSAYERELFGPKNQVA